MVTGEVGTGCASPFCKLWCGSHAAVSLVTPKDHSAGSPAILDPNVDSSKTQVCSLVEISFPVLDSSPRDQNKGLDIDPEEPQSSYQRVYYLPKVTL